MADEGSKLITVYVPQDEAENLAVGSLLHSAGIEYYSKNAGVQNLFGAGQIGGSNLITGAIEIQVAAKDLDRAKEILKEMTREPNRDLNFIPGSDSEPPELEPEPSDSEKEDDESQEIVTRLANKSVVFSILWLGGIGSIFAVYFGFKSLKRIKAGKSEPKGKVKALFGIVMGILGLALCIPFWHSFLEVML